MMMAIEEMKKYRRGKEGISTWLLKSKPQSNLHKPPTEEVSITIEPASSLTAFCAHPRTAVYAYTHARAPAYTHARTHAFSFSCTFFSYDFVVIGGGSGGSACARRAAGYGAKVALIERGASYDPATGRRVGAGIGGKHVYVVCAHTP